MRSHIVSVCSSSWQSPLLSPLLSPFCCTLSCALLIIYSILQNSSPILLLYFQIYSNTTILYFTKYYFTTTLYHSRTPPDYSVLQSTAPLLHYLLIILYALSVARSSKSIYYWSFMRSQSRAHGNLHYVLRSQLRARGNRHYLIYALSVARSW